MPGLKPASWPAAENKSDSTPAQENQTQEIFEAEAIDMGDLIAATKDQIDSIGRQVYRGEIDIFDSAEKMGRLTSEVLQEVAARFAKKEKIAPEELPFALFVFGATARQQMLPNSDLDIVLAFSEDCSEDIKAALKKAVFGLPFNDETDIAQWDSVENMKKDKCPSLMEYNKVVEARFIAGNTGIAAEHEKITRQEDSREDKEERFITEYGLLHRFDYQSRSNEHGPNLKYDFGASRDIVFLDWYYLLDNEGRAPENNQATSLACLDLMEGKGMINPEEKEELKNSLELILLTKFALWEKNIKEGDQKLLYLSDGSLDAAYDDIKNLLSKTEINDSAEYIRAYHKAKSRLNIAVKKLFLDVASRHKDLTAIWKKAKEKTELDEEVLAILENPSWNELVPFAVDSRSEEILGYIVSRFANTKGYEYILRIISENKNTGPNTKIELLDSRLDPRFKKKIAA